MAAQSRRRSHTLRCFHGSSVEDRYVHMITRILALLEHPEHDTEVRDCLESAGHEVVVVDSFARAKSLLQQSHFELIISDVHLENGGTIYDFLIWAKSEECYQTVPFVLFSLEPTPLAKYLADGVRTTSRFLGAAKYINMDRFDTVLLSKAIAELLPAVGSVQVVAKEGE